MGMPLRRVRVLGGTQRGRPGRRRVLAWIAEDVKRMLINTAEQTGISATTLIEHAIRQCYSPRVPAVAEPKEVGGPVVSSGRFAGMRVQVGDESGIAPKQLGKQQADWVDYSGDVGVPWRV